MPSYVVLFNWTDQGIKNFRDSPGRVKAATEAWGSSGVRITDVRWTIGPYDLVGFVEAPSDEALTGALLQLGAQGNVRTTTLRAFNQDEFGKVVEQAG
jgi:uncharacterized protein with GYD domain